MKLTIGENIRNLRREKNITQEEFATLFGVSYQSVSRWENGTCYPDLELLPDIAAFLGITVDKLMGADKAVEEHEVNQYLTRFQEAISQGLIYDCIDIARQGVKAYPNNYALLNKLMYALFVSGDDDGNIPQWQENAEKYDGEITALGERIMKYCPDQTIRLEATARLAFNHCLMGRKETGRAIYESLPSGENCKENAIWWALEEQEKEPFLRNKAGQNYHDLRNTMWLLATAGGLSDQDAIQMYHKIFALEQLIGDGQIPQNGWGHARLRYELALRYAKLGDKDNAMDQLKHSMQAAKAFDNRPAEQTYEGLVLGSITEERTDFDTADSRPLCEIVKDTWLNETDAFDSLKESKEYTEMLEML